MEDGQFNLDLLGGVRYFYMDLTLKFDETSKVNDDGSSTDGIVGFKGHIHLNKDWHLPFFYDDIFGGQYTYLQKTDLTYLSFYYPVIVSNHNRWYVKFWVSVADSSSLSDCFLVFRH